ncbi:MAG: amidohydrolase family protein [Sphingomonas sp.]
MFIQRLAAFAAATASLAVGSAACADTVVVTADHMVDVIAGRTVDQPQVVITDGRIVTIGHRGDAVPAGARKIDLLGETLLPGLIDMHVHLDADATINGLDRLRYADNFWAVIGVANAGKMLRAGFTTVRNVGSRDFNDVALKQGVEHGDFQGPRIVPATYLIGATGGHCDDTGDLPPSLDHPQFWLGSGPEQMRAIVRRLRKYGAEVIKICATGGVLSKTDAPGAQQLSFEEMKAIADEAHMLGLKVAAHAHGTAGINDALRAGIDTIEHASLADAESFRLAKAHGAWFDMDIYDDDYILAEGPKNGMYPESLAKERAIGLKQRETFRAAHAAGVKMIYGTDNGAVFPAGQNGSQFAKMVEWGMTPIEAIRAATSNAAEALGRTDDVGAIAAGRYGDMIAVKGDPLRDIHLLEQPDMVMKGGQVIR